MIRDRKEEENKLLIRGAARIQGENCQFGIFTISADYYQIFIARCPVK
jgi:hypothetical protein